jgi:lipopolysaccharide transport system permease protein
MGRRRAQCECLQRLWDFRGLLAALAIWDDKLRYRKTALGVAWVVLQPLLASGLLVFVCGTVAGIVKAGDLRMSRRIRKSYR